MDQFFLFILHPSLRLNLGSVSALFSFLLSSLVFFFSFLFSLVSLSFLVMSRSDSRAVDSRSSEFPKADSGSFDPIREEEEGREGDASNSNQKKFEDQRNNQPRWTSSSSSFSASSDGSRSGAAFHSSSSSSDDNGTNRTSVSSFATPSVDQSGHPVMETITKTTRMINGQPMPTETTRSSIPIEQLQQQSQPSLQQQNQQQMIE